MVDYTVSVNGNEQERVKELARKGECPGDGQMHRSVARFKKTAGHCKVLITIIQPSTKNNTKYG